MVEKVEFSEATSHPTDTGTADADVWVQLAEFASRADADPVLRLLVGEAITAHRNLRGVTATIANRYRAMIDAVPDAITIHDESGLILDANASACQLLDRERERAREADEAEDHEEAAEGAVRERARREDSVVGRVELRRAVGHVGGGPVGH